MHDDTPEVLCRLSFSQNSTKWHNVSIVIRMSHRLADERRSKEERRWIGHDCQSATKEERQKEREGRSEWEKKADTQRDIYVLGNEDQRTENECERNIYSGEEKKNNVNVELKKVNG